MKNVKKGKTHKILIVDDDESILDSISMTLEDEGYFVSTTPKGEETYKIVDEFMPDLILLDILMSGKDGREICKNLKKDENTKNIPVILISAHPSAAESYHQSGAEDFLAKPFELSSLLTIIESNISKK